MALGIPFMFRRVLFFLLFFILLGCTGVRGYYLSKPIDLTQERLFVKNGVFSLPEIDLYIRPTNGVAFKSGVAIGFVNFYDPLLEEKEYRLDSVYYNYELLTQRPSFFYVELLVSTKESDVALDMSKVVLGVQSAQYHPVGYIGSMKVQSKWNYSRSLCQLDQRRQVESEKVVVLKKGEDHCLALRFDVAPPLPNSNFFVKIGGLRVNGAEIIMPKVSFETITSIFYHP